RIRPKSPLSSEFAFNANRVLPTRCQNGVGRQMIRLYSLAITVVVVVVGPAGLVTGAQATKSVETAEREAPTGSGSSRIDLGFMHPLPASEPAICRECRCLLPEAKDHIYVFLVNGLDPLYYANLNGLSAYLHELGFKRAEAMQMTSTV